MLYSPLQPTVGHTQGDVILILNGRQPARSSIPDREMVNPFPPATVQVMPEVEETHSKGPTPVADP